MSLGMRKLVVVGTLVAILLLSNALVLAHWLAEAGVINWANGIWQEYATGTAITVILALLVLLTSPKRVADECSRWIKRCRVCDHMLIRRGSYCPECGSRV
jgi:hypothetical protein